MKDKFIGMTKAQQKELIKEAKALRQASIEFEKKISALPGIDMRTLTLSDVRMSLAKIRWDWVDVIAYLETPLDILNTNPERDL